MLNKRGREREGGRERVRGSAKKEVEKKGREREKEKALGMTLM